MDVTAWPVIKIFQRQTRQLHALLIKAHVSLYWTCNCINWILVLGTWLWGLKVLNTAVKSGNMKSVWYPSLKLFSKFCELRNTPYTIQYIYCVLNYFFSGLCLSGLFEKSHELIMHLFCSMVLLLLFFGKTMMHIKEGFANMSNISLMNHCDRT